VFVGVCEYVFEFFPDCYIGLLEEYFCGASAVGSRGDVLLGGRGES